MNLPYCKFFYRDWLADLQLRQCSTNARAIWADMLCLMGLNDAHYGYMEARSGGPLQDEEIARLSCNRVEDVKSALAELENAGIFSRDESGIIFSRRMVKDRAKHEARRQAGAVGGRNTQARAQAVASPFAQANAQAKSGAPNQAEATAAAQPQNPESRDQRNGEEMDGAPAAVQISMPDNWRLTAAFVAFRKTGKFANLTPELLAMVDRNYPRARLSENYTELVEAARSLPGSIGEPHGWLNKKASQIELRLQKRDTIKFPAPPRSHIDTPRTELRATEKLVML